MVAGAALAAQLEEGAAYPPAAAACPAAEAASADLGGAPPEAVWAEPWRSPFGPSDALSARLYWT